MLNDSKIHRSGSNPRVIFYSQSTKGHEYNYGNPIVSITGRNSRHITQNCSAERKLFSNIKLHPLPNSRRTINPDYENPQIKKFNNARKYKWKNSTMDYTLCESESKKTKPIIKLSDKKNKTSEELKQNENKDKKNKGCFSFYIKKKYDYNSEILNLPGGSKREINDIKDDLNKISNDKRKLNTTANCFRKRDFNNSKIICLKTSVKNKNQNIRNKIIDFTKKNLPFYNCYTNENIVKNKNDIKYEYNKEFNNDNIYEYNKRENNKRNISEVSKENSENYFNKEKFKNIRPFKNYVNDSFKPKKNDLITHYTRKRDIKSYNKLFNEVHEENSKYSLIKYYGNNYSKKNYTQFELN